MTSPNMSRGESQSKVLPIAGSRPPSVTIEDKEREREREREKERDRPVSTPFALGASQYAKIPPSSHSSSQVASPRPSWGTPPPPKRRSSDEYITSKSSGNTPVLPVFGPPPPASSSLPKSPPPRIPPVQQGTSPRSLNASGGNSRTHSPTLLRERSPPLGLAQKGLVSKVPPDITSLTTPGPTEPLKNSTRDRDRDDDYPPKASFNGVPPPPTYPLGSSKPISESPRITRMSVPQMLDAQP